MRSTAIRISRLLPNAAICTLIRPIASLLECGRTETGILNNAPPPLLFSSSALCPTSIRPSRRTFLPHFESSPTPRVVSFADFETLVARDKATAEDALACLYHQQAKLASLPLDQRWKEAAKPGVGRKVLLWILEHHRADPHTVLVGGHKNLTNILCWFILAEGLEEQAWRWLKIAAEQRFNGLLPCWPSRLTAGLAHAHMSWDTSGMPVNEVLACFKKAYVTLEPCGDDRGKLLIFFINQIQNWLDGEVGYTAFDTCLFDYFQETASRDLGLLFDLDTRRNMRGSTLHLYHPERPEATHWLKYFRAEGSLTTFYARHLRRSITARSLRACYILRHQAQITDAVWLENQIRRQYPTEWRLRTSIAADLDQDPKLHNIRSSDIFIPWRREDIDDTDAE